jgi:hypothetical protein
VLIKDALVSVQSVKSALLCRSGYAKAQCALSAMQSQMNTRYQRYLREPAHASQIKIPTICDIRANQHMHHRANALISVQIVRLFPDQSQMNLRYQRYLREPADASRINILKSCGGVSFANRVLLKL